MPRKRSPVNPPCSRCGAAEVNRNSHKDGKPHWACLVCGRSFSPTFGTAMDRQRTLPVEGARPLFIGIRCGRFRAAEEITGHQYETIRRWLRLAAQPADAITEALAHDLHLTEVEVDAFWSLVRKSTQMLVTPSTHRAGWARAGDIGVRIDPPALERVPA